MLKSDRFGMEISDMKTDLSYWAELKSDRFGMEIYISWWVIWILHG